MTLTITLQSLSDNAPEQGAAQAAEGGPLVIVNFEPVRHVDTEPSRRSLCIGILLAHGILD